MTHTAQRRGVVTALALIAFFVAWTVREFQPPDDMPIAAASPPRPRVRTIVASGTLQPVTTVQVGAQVSGTVQSLRADYNSIVHAGEVIATLEPSLFEAALREAQAALARAQAAEAQAEADEAGLEAAAGDARMKLDRAASLAASELIPQADLDSARSALGEANIDLEGGESRISEAKAVVLQAQAAVGEATINLDRTVIRSPIDGIVIARSADVGQTVAAAVQAPVLFTIAADLKRLQLAVDVDESDVGGIGAGMRATFEVESYPEEAFNGTVSQVRLQPAAGTAVSYTVIVDVANPDERLRPGMTATVTIVSDRTESRPARSAASAPGPG